MVKMCKGNVLSAVFMMLNRAHVTIMLDDRYKVFRLHTHTHTRTHRTRLAIRFQCDGNVSTTRYSHTSHTERVDWDDRHHALVQWKRLLASYLSVCPFSWNNSASTGQISMKFDISRFFRKSVHQIQVSLKFNNKAGALHEGLCKFVIFRWSLLRIRNVSDKDVDEVKTQFYSVTKMTEPDRPQMKL